MSTPATRPPKVARPCPQPAGISMSAAPALWAKSRSRGWVSAGAVTRSHLARRGSTLDAKWTALGRGRSQGIAKFGMGLSVEHPEAVVEPLTAGGDDDRRPFDAGSRVAQWPGPVGASGVDDEEVAGIRRSARGDHEAAVCERGDREQRTLLLAQRGEGGRSAAAAPVRRRRIDDGQVAPAAEVEQPSAPKAMPETMLRPWSGRYWTSCVTRW